MEMHLVNVGVHDVAILKIQGTDINDALGDELGNTCRTDVDDVIWVVLDNETELGDVLDITDEVELNLVMHLGL